MYAIRRHICVLIMLLFSTGVYAQKDYSNNSSIVIDEPSLAHVNITGIESLPMTKNDNLHAWFEYSDDNGNYFKKRVIVNAQGATSLHYPKKNLSIDFCEDEWVGNKTTNITIGNWVKQDAFHFKANWLDSFRGGLAVYTTYKFYDDIVKDRPHILERAGITDYSKNVLCHPDGFPCVISLNGEFYGIYAWQLKKHRKNMGMQKDNPVQVWVQVDTYTDSFRSGEVDWDALDIRNPKKATQESKDIICKFAKYNNELSELCSTLSDDAMRQEIEKRYDVASFIDFIIYGLVTSNIDGFGKNVQLFTYDGVKWFVAPYDLDQTFGISWVGSFLFPPEWSWISADYRMNESTNKVPYNWIMKYFWTDIKDRYATLRKNNVISEENVLQHLAEWNWRVGDKNYALEYKKWSTCPSNGQSQNNAQWACVEDWSNYNALASYDNDKSYNSGDCCVYDYRVWKAVQPVKGVLPVAQKGYTDTEERVRGWIKRRLELEDKYLDYNPNADIQSIPAFKPKKQVQKRLINNQVVISVGDKDFFVNGVEK